MDKVIAMTEIMKKGVLFLVSERVNVSCFGRRASTEVIYRDIHLVSNMRVIDNIKFASNYVDYGNIYYILRDLGIYSKKNTLVRELSVLDKHLVSFACALVSNPKVIFIDEPLLQLDFNCWKKVMYIIKRLSLRRVIVVISNDLEIAQEYGDKIIKDDGKVFFDDCDEKAKRNRLFFRNPFILKIKKILDL